MAELAGKHVSIEGVVKSDTGTPLSNFPIELFYRESRNSEIPLGLKLNTDLSGKYKFQCAVSDLMRISGEKLIGSIFIRASTNAGIVEKSRARKIATSIKTNFTINTDELLLLADNVGLVKGAVKYDSNSPAPDATVQALHQNIKGFKQLSEIPVSKQGRYRIIYVLHPKLREINLQLRLLDDKGQELERTKTIFCAKRSETVDIKTARSQKSEWDMLHQRYVAVSDGLSIKELSDQQLKFVTGAAKFTKDHIQTLVEIESEQIQSNLPDWFLFALKKKYKNKSLEEAIDDVSPAIEELIAESVDRNFISEVSSREIKALGQKIEKLRAGYALDGIFRSSKLSVETVLSLSGIRDSKKPDLALRLKETSLTSRDGFKDACTKAALTNREIEKLELTSDLAEITDNNVEIISAIHNQENIRSTRELARQYRLTDWEYFIGVNRKKGGFEVPPCVEGNSEKGRREKYARMIYESISERHPEVAVLNELHLSGREDQVALSKYAPAILDKNPEFDLGRSNITEFVNSNAASLGVTNADKKGLTVELKRAQRVFRLDASPDNVTTILNEGFGSAAEIARMGRTEFREKTKNLGDSKNSRKADNVYDKAVVAAAKVTAYAAAVDPRLGAYLSGGSISSSSDGSSGSGSSVPATSVGDCPAGMEETPHIASLFGPLDGCECVDCESVTSVSAYYADLLNFVDTHIRAIQDHTLFDSFPVDDNGKKTGLAALIVRSFCDRLGGFHSRVDRRPDLVKLLLNCKNTNTEIPYIDLVNEVLEAAIANDANSGRQTTLASLWLATQPEHFNPSAYEKLGKAVYPIDIPFELKHEYQKILLDGLDTDLHTLLRKFEPYVALDTAGSGTATASNTFDIGYSDPNAIALARLGLSEQQAKNIIADTVSTTTEMYWGFPLTPGDSWWQPLRNTHHLITRAKISYNDLLILLSLRSFNPEGSIKIAETDTAKCDPKEIYLAELDVNALAFLSSFLRLAHGGKLTYGQLDLLLLKLGEMDSNGRPIIDHSLLSRLGKVLILSEKFNVSHEEILVWWSTINTTSYGIPQKPDLAKPSIYHNLFLSGNSGADTSRFLLSNDGTELQDSTTPIADSIADISGALRSSESEVSVAVGEVFPDSSTLNLNTLSMVFRYLSFASSLGVSVAKLLRLIELIGFDPLAASVGDIDQRIDSCHQFIEFVEKLDESDLNEDDLIYLLIETISEEWSPASIDQLITGLDEEATSDAHIEILAANLSNTLSISSDVVTLLLQETVPSLLDSLFSYIAEKQDVTIDDPTLGSVGLKAIYLLEKCALLIRSYGIGDSDLAEILGRASIVGWLDFASMPVSSGDARIPFVRWCRLNALLALRDHLNDPLEMFSLFDNEIASAGATPTDIGNLRRQYISKLVGISDWSHSDVEALIGKSDVSEVSHGGGGILQPIYPEHFNDERLPLRISQLISYADELNVDITEMHGWVAPLNMTNIPVERQFNSLKKQEGDQWRGVAKKLRDNLREKQRDALVSYLLNEWQLETTEQLFDHFLLDIEMSSCMQTSRLVQAVASVQLFVQRVLMNLEPGWRMLPEGESQWYWVKRYRLWEANRKVFLYPENWIEPELRDDKSHFFTELEGEILQSKLDDKSAADALGHYFEKLHNISRMQVCGVYVADSVIHVFARTPEEPHHYYYQKGIVLNTKDGLNTPLRWTSWESVDVEIEGDHLIPIVNQGRVYLFWPVFKAEDEAPFTHLLDSILSLYGKIWELIKNIGAVFTVASYEVVAAPFNLFIDGINEMLSVFEDTVNSFIETVKNVQFPPPPSPGVKPFDFLELIDGVGEINRIEKPEFLNNLGDVSFDSLLEDVLGIVGEYADYLLSFFPSERVEVRMAWSEYDGAAWSAKRTSDEYVYFSDKLGKILQNLPETGGVGYGGIKRLTTFQGGVPGGFDVVDSNISTDESDLLISCNLSLPDFLESVATERVGVFRFNVLSNQMEATNINHEIQELAVLKSVIENIFVEALPADFNTQSLLPGFKMLRQRGVPITPDDDPANPSALRQALHLQLPHPEQYRLMSLHQVRGGDPELSKTLFFYKNLNRTLYFQKSSSTWLVDPYYHPFTFNLLAQIRQKGIAGIYEKRYELNNGKLIESQGSSGQHLQLALKKSVSADYSNISAIEDTLNDEEFSFSSRNSYSIYNWEIFFHIPLLIANQLHVNQNFEEAQNWFHYLFNPTDSSLGDVPQRYWRTKPFVERTKFEYAFENIEELLLLLNTGGNDEERQLLEVEIENWRRDAFNPHLIARTRSIAYQKSVVMKYIDNLIAWGDSLFRKETREDIYEAIQLYVLAAKLLGPRPKQIVKSSYRDDKTYAELKPSFDNFSNALVELENYIDYDNDSATDTTSTTGMIPMDLVLSPSLRNSIAEAGEGLYFCIPPNEKLLSKWDLVSDRLFKVRNCLNIDGEGLTLPLLSPPIDPAILVRAKAEGIDINHVISTSLLKNYRFQVIHQKALEFCSEVRALGNAFLSAVEKQDGEELSRLRSTQELALLQSIRTSKIKQVEEAKLGYEGIQINKESQSIRLQHYQNLFREYMIPEEIASVSLTSASLLLQTIQFNISLGASVTSLLPDIKAGFLTTVGMTHGGAPVTRATENSARSIGQLASLLSSLSGLISTMGGYRRRAIDWSHQIDVIGKELEGLDKQLAAAAIRQEIAEQDLENHKLQMEHNQQTQEYMSEKYSNKELYTWMQSELSTLYFQTYQKAYELAQSAERAMINELGLDESIPTVIKSGYWNSLKQGLLSGDKLYSDLKKLELKYMEANSRDMELTRDISLKRLDPFQLLVLRATGSCDIRIPETLFDMDYPGHYLRRIKTVSVSIPCVSGPFTNVNSKLTLVKHGVRPFADVPASGTYELTDDPNNFTDEPQTGAEERFIVTSGAQNDSGMFELNLRDERYLPFELAGVVSDWKLEMSANDNNQIPRQFDYDSIADVILHISYTAKQGKEALRNAAIQEINTAVSGAGTSQLMSAKHDFSTEWAKFKGQTPDSSQRFSIEITPSENNYPFWSLGRLNSVGGVGLMVQLAADSTSTTIEVFDSPDAGAGNSDTLSEQTSDGYVYGSLSNISFPSSPLDLINLFFDTNEIENLWLIVDWA